LLFGPGNTVAASRSGALCRISACTVLGVLVAPAVVEDNGAQGFGADHAWFYVNLLTIGYMISRGTAKAGSSSKDDDPRINN
jgi:hypothetical protein